MRSEFDLQRNYHQILCKRNYKVQLHTKKKAPSAGKKNKKIKNRSNQILQALP